MVHFLETLNTEGHVMAIKPRLSFTPNSFLAKVGEGRSIGKYRKEQIVFSQGDPRMRSSTSRKARLRLPSFRNKARKPSSHFLERNDFFGEGCLVGQVQRIASVATMTDSVIVRLEKRLLSRNPSGTSILRDVHCPSCGPGHPRRSRPCRSAVQFERETSCRLLLLLANFGKEGKPEPIIAKISQETLAEMIGTTRSRVSFFMNKFRQLA